LACKTPIQDLKESSSDESDTEEEETPKADVVELPVQAPIKVSELPVHSPIKMREPIPEIMNEETPVRAISERK